MNPKLERLSERLRQLIDEGRSVARLESPSIHVGPYIQAKIPLHSWLVKVDNIVAATFGKTSVHYLHVREKLNDHPEHAYQVEAIVGILIGALDDLENGYLVGQEHLIVADLFDGLLEQAEHLVRNGFKDAAAVLGRVVLEDSLRRLCNENGLDASGKAASMNDALLKSTLYAKPRWRQIQAWLDLGNSAAHGKFAEFSDAEIATMLSGIRDFLAQSYSP